LYDVFVGKTNAFKVRTSLCVRLHGVVCVGYEIHTDACKSFPTSVLGVAFRTCRQQLNQYLEQEVNLYLMDFLEIPKLLMSPSTKSMEAWGSALWQPRWIQLEYSKTSLKEITSNYQQFRVE